MRLGTIYTPEGGTQAVRVTDSATFALPFADVGAVLAQVPDLDELSAAGEPGPAAGQVAFAPVVPRPGKVICVGLNYRTHIAEMGREEPEYPTLFAKFAESLVGAADDIVLPRDCETADWEAELALVIGRPVRYADRKDAASAIAGYTVANDVSVRSHQWRTTQWLQGKTFESTTPIGPVLVTPEEIDHAGDLAITCTVDGQERQASRTSDLLFSPAELVSYVSHIVTLMPGDVLLTGTPGGVGAGLEPPTYLKQGHVLRTSIEGIGTCTNTCVTDPVHVPVPTEGESD